MQCYFSLFYIVLIYLWLLIPSTMASIYLALYLFIFCYSSFTCLFSSHYIISLFTMLSICLSIFHFPPFLFSYLTMFPYHSPLFIYLSTNLYILLPSYLPIYLAIYFLSPLIHLFPFLFTYLLIHPYLSIYCPFSSIFLSIYLSLPPFIYLPIYFPFALSIFPCSFPYLCKAVRHCRLLSREHRAKRRGRSCSRRAGVGWPEVVISFTTAQTSR